MNELEKVRARHSEIPQDALPGLDVPVAAQGGGSPVSRSATSVAFAVCPSHLRDVTARNEGMTGLVRTADGELVFRDHTKRLGSVSVPCSGSGSVPPQEAS